MDSGGRTPALVHATYQHEAFPLPLPDRNFPSTPPELTAHERTVLDAHRDGVTLQHLSKSQSIDANVLSGINKSLRVKLHARTSAHAVRRAWETGLYGRTRCANTPSANPGVHRDGSTGGAGRHVIVSASNARARSGDRPRQSESHNHPRAPYPATAAPLT
jgi:hypothetical protein